MNDHWLMNYTIKKDDENPEATVVEHFQRLLLMFMCLVRSLLRVWRSSDSSESLEIEWFVPKSIRMCLWYLLAEPNTESARDIISQVFLDSNRTPQELWRKVIESIEADALDIDIKQVLAEEWKRTAPHLSNDYTNGKPLLLIVWDEARALVESGIDGKIRRQESSLSKFRTAMQFSACHFSMIGS